MKYSILTIPIVLFISLSCQGPQSEEAMLFDSLEKLPSVPVNEATSFSLGSENILISGKQQKITLKTIQLWSGSTAAIQTGTETICLDNSSDFNKYPFASKQIFQLNNSGLEVSQLQFISKDKPGITLLYSIKNVDNSAKSIRFKFQPNVDLKPSLLMDSTFGSNAADQIIYDELTGIFTAKDQDNNWYAAWGTSTDFNMSPTISDCTQEISESGASAGFEISLELAANEERVIPIFIAGSDLGEFTAMEILADLRKDLYTDWDENFALVDSLRKTAKITIPDQELHTAYDWAKYKVGSYKFDKYQGPASPIEDPDEIHRFLKELTKEFTAQVDEALFFFDKNKPRHIAPGWDLIQPTTLLLMGIHGDAVNRVTYIRPNLPKDWKDISVDNLWIEDNKINISIRSDEDQITVEVTQTQKKVGISIELPEEFSKVKVLGKEVSNDTKDGFRRILMTGDHVKIEALKN
ncbi:hypothetical protein LV84_01504 [Algoriphagus ratkowskyi]|uniref:Uncharacterized protein n=1 Tax=Algoriphagus ratkowskyi TaxID=57028 RepID=A0A2W7RIQ3_9BACT|nr:hypothetical protein [Algoriphagus ratkowskyi]PZX58300.1 hypothetical protein LV84_01504 [Algoriphagus ratkowskyi]TXD77824.1 hypothetical protein ESW18_10695 [Algoriphagus ratkowskyi]